MAANEEVAALLSGAEKTPAEKVLLNLNLAKKEVLKMLNATGSSVFDLCNNIERARTRDGLKAAFSEFNMVVRIFLEAAPTTEHDNLVRDTLCSVHLSERLLTFLESASTVPEALAQYKAGVVTDLASILRNQAAMSLLDDDRDDELLLRLLPQPDSTGPDDERLVDDVAPNLVDVNLPSKKRAFSSVDELPSIPRLSKVPALASISRMQQLIEHGEASKRQALLTRQKLRTGMHDPRGLLRMVSSSTNALERAKELEILKSAGFVLHDDKKSLRKTSFSDKLMMATTRLELGLGGHTLSDTLLFGAKVLSTPGVLSPKNILDIENNIVDAKTSWRHQNAYARMVIAGCLNQAKSIFEKFDDILYGPAPEKLVGETHDSIRKLLASQECRKFLNQASGDDKSVMAAGDEFVRKVTEAVVPIIPITLRNRSLDGSYFRTALQFVAAAEFLFTQYEADVRVKANPAGVVGMCNSMHADIKKAAMFNDKLSQLDSFMKEMKAQYQTSLGLGSAFPRDISIQGSRRGRRRRGRSSYRSDRYQGQSTPRDFGVIHQQEFAGYGRGRASRHHYPNSRAFYEGAQPRSGGTAPSHEPCFNYQAGNCNRGRSCRYTH